MGAAKDGENASKRNKTELEVLLIAHKTASGRREILSYKVDYNDFEIKTGRVEGTNCGFRAAKLARAGLWRREGDESSENL